MSRMLDVRFSFVYDLRRWGLGFTLSATADGALELFLGPVCLAADWSPPLL
jgi:hypothetical protein